jgi:hypothetical protein
LLKEVVEPLLKKVVEALLREVDPVLESDWRETIRWASRSFNLGLRSTATAAPRVLTIVWTSSASGTEAILTKPDERWLTTRKTLPEH